jgi:hypothetical protein
MVRFGELTSIAVTPLTYSTVVLMTSPGIDYY